jgi:hypothetical protein
LKANGKLHREKGPASISLEVETDIGEEDITWYQNGHYHRLDGPAIVKKERKWLECDCDGTNCLYHSHREWYIDNCTKWYIHDICVTKRQHDKTRTMLALKLDKI